MSDQLAVKQANEFVAASRQQWETLVRLCFEHRFNREKLAKSLARLSDGNKETLRRKIKAIDAAGRAGLETQDIIDRGQKAIMGEFLRHKNGPQEPETMIRHRVASSLAHAYQEDIERIGRVCKLRTTNELFEFFHAHWSTMTDEELIHETGETEERKRR